jgi:hypothetical protein
MESVIEADGEVALGANCRETGRSPQAVVIELLRRPLAARRLAAFREEFIPCAEGFFAGEDVFRDVS